MIRRVLAILSVAAFALVGPFPVGPAAAEPSVVLGRTAGSMPSTCAGSPDLEAFQLSSAPGTPTTAPFAGVVTSWSFLASTQDTVLTLRIFRQVDASSFTPVADGGPLQTVPANTGEHTFPTRITVQRGDSIGLRSTSGACAAQTGDTKDVALVLGGTATPLGGSATYTASSGFIENIAATLEPDADLDGYGDETQDRCPTRASTQRPCPPSPNTVITKKPTKKTSHHAKSKVYFTASPPAQSFMCQLDHGPVVGCTSPAVFKCLEPGKHKFRVFALNSSTSLDTTPAVAKWRVREPRKGC